MKNKLNNKTINQNLDEKYKKLDRNLKKEIINTLNIIKESKIIPLMNKTHLSINDEQINFVVNNVFREYLLPTFLKDGNLNFVNNDWDVGNKIENVIEKNMNLNRFGFNNVEINNVSNLINSIQIGNFDFDPRYQELGYTHFEKFGLTESLSSIINIHGDGGQVNNDEYNFFRNDLNIYRLEDLRGIIDFKDEKYDNLYSFIEKIKDNNDIDKKLIERFENLYEDYLSFGFVYINKDFVNKVIKNKEALELLIDNIENEIDEDMGICLINEDGMIGDGYDKYNLSHLLILDIIRRTSTELVDYIEGDNLIIFLERLLYDNFNIDTHFGSKEYDYKISKDFNKVPNHFKEIILLMIVDVLKNHNEEFIKELQGSDKKVFDLFDILSFSFKANGLDVSKNMIKSKLYKNSFKDLILALTNKNDYIDEIYNNNLKLKYLLHNGEGNNFIIDIDVENVLIDMQESKYLWNEEIYDKAIEILSNKHTRKSQYLLNELDFDKNDSKNLQKYLEDQTIYEYDDYVLFEYDGVNEILSMGIGPQASCQNILLETGYNEHILSNATLNPYTKLMMGFKKPKGFKGIDFDKKEIIINDENGNEIRQNLKIENRMLMVLGDIDRSNGFLLQHNYGRFVDDNILKDLNNKLNNKYSKIGKSLSTKYKKDKKESLEKYDSWFYEEGDGE